MKKTLLIVDMQNGFLTEQNYVKLKEKINKLINKNLYDEYIFTKFVNKKGSLYETQLNWLNLQDKKSQQLCVEVPKNSIIFKKYGYGLKNNQIKKLQKLNLTSVDVCGLKTDACVYAIALQLFDNNIFPNILINYCETNESLKQPTKAILIRQFGKIDNKK